MNTKTLITSALIAAGIISQASAQQRVYITGSTAYRNAANKTITAMFDASPAVQIAAYGNTTYFKANFVDWEGTIGGTNYIVKAAWSGSEAGVQDLAQPRNESFVDDIGQGTPAVAVGASASNPVAGQENSHSVDIAFADAQQSFSKNKTPILTGQMIGIIPFVFDKNAQVAADQTGTDWAAISNITDAQFRVAEFSGGILSAQITGRVGDTNHFVYIEGRDDGSGTRVNTFGETAVGIRASVLQAVVGGGAGAPTITGFTQQGESSGGTIATKMGWNGSLEQVDGVSGNTGFILIGYFGLSDAETAEAANGGGANGAQRLSYNGVAESTAAIQNGEYSYWGNEYFYKEQTPTAAANTVFSLLAAGVNAQTDGTHEISTTSMNCTRQGPTSDPAHN